MTRVAMVLQDSPNWLTTFNVIVAVVIFLVTVAGGVILLLVSRRNTVTLIQTERIAVNEGLAKDRLQQLDECTKKCEKCKIELEDVTTELRAQMGLDIDKLMAYWKIKEFEEIRAKEQEAVIRQLKMRLGEPI
jgi:hypothetical protein